MPLIVGITGGIGSGKTLIGRIFSELGVPVFNADVETKSAYKNTAFVQLIAARWPEAVSENGSVLTDVIGTHVFQDKDELAWLESILHPYTRQRWEAFIKEHHDAPYIMKESAILIQSKTHASCNHIILVKAEKSERIRRVQMRSNLSESEILKRMEAQMSEDEISKYCDYTIINQEPHSVIAQVLKIHESLLSRAI